MKLVYTLLLHNYKKTLSKSRATVLGGLQSTCCLTQRSSKNLREPANQQFVHFIQFQNAFLSNNRMDEQTFSVERRGVREFDLEKFLQIFNYVHSSEWRSKVNFLR